MSAREERHGGDGASSDDGSDDGVRVDVTLHGGQVHLREGDGPGVLVRVEADPDAGGSWWGGLAGVLGRVEGHLAGDLLGAPADAAQRAVEATRVSWDEATRALTVVAPDEWALRSVPLVVTVHAAAVSALRVHASAADVDADLPVGEVDVETTGRVDLVETRARGTLRCGAGDLRVGTARGPLRIRGGAGQVAVGHALGPVEVTSGAGSVRLGEVRADVAVRLAGGDVEVADAAGGDLELTTGAGSVRVGVHAGTDARLDLHSGAGSARSELAVRSERPQRPTGSDGPAGEPVRIRARAGAGDVLVHAARTA